MNVIETIEGAINKEPDSNEKIHIRGRVISTVDSNGDFEFMDIEKTQKTIRITDETKRKKDFLKAGNLEFLFEEIINLSLVFK